MKQRKDLIKVKAKPKAGLVAVGASTYHYAFPANGEPVEVLRSDFAKSHFDAVRERLEVLEDPVLVRDQKPDKSSLTAGRATRRT